MMSLGVSLSRTPGPFRHFTHLKSIFVLVIFSWRFSSLLLHSTKAKPNSKGPGLGRVVWRVTRLALRRPVHQAQSSFCSRHSASVSLEWERGTRAFCGPDPARARAGVSAALEVHQNEAKRCRQVPRWGRTGCQGPRPQRATTARCFRAGRWQLGRFPSQERRQKWLPGKGLTPPQVPHPVVRSMSRGGGGGWVQELEDRGGTWGLGLSVPFTCREDSGEVRRAQPPQLCSHHPRCPWERPSSPPALPSQPESLLVSPGINSSWTESKLDATSRGHPQGTQRVLLSFP